MSEEKKPKLDRALMRVVGVSMVTETHDCAVAATDFEEDGTTYRIDLRTESEDCEDFGSVLLTVFRRTLHHYPIGGAVMISVEPFGRTDLMQAAVKKFRDAREEYQTTFDKTDPGGSAARIVSAQDLKNDAGRELGLAAIRLAEEVIRSIELT